MQAVGTLMATLPGMRFYHQGELEGRQIHLPITLRMAADEPADPVSVSFFGKILGITREDVFHTGQWSLLPVANEGDCTSENLVVYEWRSGDVWKIVVINLSGWAFARARPSRGSRLVRENLRSSRPNRRRPLSPQRRGTFNPRSVRPSRRFRRTSLRRHFRLGECKH